MTNLSHNYLHTKFRSDISISGRDITTSSCWKQTFAIFKFYSRFRLWLLQSTLWSVCDSVLACQILYETEAHRQSYDVILISQDGGHSIANLLPVSGLAKADI